MRGYCVASGMRASARGAADVSVVAEDDITATGDAPERDGLVGDVRVAFRVVACLVRLRWRWRERGRGRGEVLLRAVVGDECDLY